MKQRIIIKGLAVAVILLFIGVGIQPAVATVEQETIEESKYQEYPPIIRCILLYIGMGIIYSIMEILEDYEDNPTIDMLTTVLLLIYALMGVRFLYLTGVIP